MVTACLQGVVVVVEGEGLVGVRGECSSDRWCGDGEGWEGGECGGERRRGPSYPYAIAEKRRKGKIIL